MIFLDSSKTGGDYQITNEVKMETKINFFAFFPWFLKNLGLKCNKMLIVSIGVWQKKKSTSFDLQGKRA